MNRDNRKLLNWIMFEIFSCCFFISSIIFYHKVPICVQIIIKHFSHPVTDLHENKNMHLDGALSCVQSVLILTVCVLFMRERTLRDVRRV